MTWAQFHSELQGKRIIQRYSQVPVERSFVYSLHCHKPSDLTRIIANVHPRYIIIDAKGWENGKCYACRETTY